MSKLGWALAALVTFVVIGVITKKEDGPTPKPSGPKGTPLQRVLLVGDSMGQGLTAPLKALVEANGGVFSASAKQSTRIDQWASSSTEVGASLEERLVAFKPTVVIVALGTNDEYMTTSAVAKQATHVETIQKKVAASGAALLWIGPPSLPKPTNGITPMLAQRVGESFFHSEQLSIPRIGDQIHPTTPGYKQWAAAFWAWLT